MQKELELMEKKEYVLQRKISEKRKEMVKTANLYGLSDVKTVQESQELDLLINKYFLYKNNSM
ncbi:aspartyl-phosphate phosphatase Spo0E family protein [Aquibacillus sp. 3ASR75-11]|uniref:Aspartyl-phosphate phosphatase Spo0E family protein n=1 Tax=Terrihalobacillus insolitus TaxID=2950438 RepID=A0A9X3WPK3_9BACI|nr:aspartyl-phosphate phosphatase Spo0E family protein [Terrihalobacillus insolitus]MDC3412746.1 aspartyl-phosphate phosphatase Spo0E family protein [Terrihalobacillus insolitus]MDC3423777.1 aspartyl-phosphate phosphatase Spo0E family protein [Terrihalobacillus insolitus]